MMPRAADGAAPMLHFSWRYHLLLFCRLIRCQSYAASAMLYVTTPLLLISLLDFHAFALF